MADPWDQLEPAAAQAGKNLRKLRGAVPQAEEEANISLFSIAISLRRLTFDFDEHNKQLDRIATSLSSGQLRNTKGTSDA